MKERGGTRGTRNSRARPTAADTPDQKPAKKSRGDPSPTTPAPPPTGKKLKQILEKVWNETPCLHPNHVTMWVGATDELGGYDVGAGVRHRKGTLAGKAKPTPPVFPK